MAEVDPEARAWAADDLMLRVLQNAVAEPDPRAIENGRAVVAKYLSGQPDASAAWDELVAGNWIRVVWEQWHVVRVKRRPDRDQSAAAKRRLSLLAHLQEVAGGGARLVVPGASIIVDDHRNIHPGTPTLEGLIGLGLLERRDGAILIAENWPRLGVSGPEIVAKLWDGKEAGPSGRQRLSWWRDRVFGIIHNWHGFGGHLGRRGREEFRRAAWELILSEPDLRGWEEERRRIETLIASANGMGEIDRELVSPVPDEPLGRFEWSRHEARHDNDEERELVGALVLKLLEWRLEFPDGAPWHEWISEYVTAAESRPYLLNELSDLVSRDPVHAADLLLIPHAAALALWMLVGRTRHTGSVWEPEVHAAHERARHDLVWPDVVECGLWSVLRRAPELVTTDIAALVERFYEAERRAYSPMVGGDPRRADAIAMRKQTFLDHLRSWPAANDALALDSVGGPVAETLARRAKTENELESAATRALIWLVGSGADEHSPWRRFGARLLIDCYQGVLRARDWWWVGRFDGVAWARLASFLERNAPDEWSLLLAPPALPASALDDSVDDELVMPSVRTHAFLLLSLVIEWPRHAGVELAPEALQQALEEWLGKWLPGTQARPSLIDAAVDIELMYELPRESMVVTIAHALPRLTPDRHRRIREVLLSATTEVRQLACFINAASSDDDASAARAILKRFTTLEGATTISDLREVWRTVDALIEADEVDRAEAWLAAWSGRIDRRTIDGWIRWEVSAIQRVRLHRGRFEEAAAAPLPAWAGDSDEARAANDFYRGVAMLNTKPARATHAAQIFGRLHKRARHNTSYAVNLIAARTNELLDAADEEYLAAGEVEALQRLLADADSLMETYSAEQRAHVETTYQVNRLLILHRLRDWGGLLEAFWKLPPTTQRDPTLASYAARAMAVSGQAALAHEMRMEMRAPNSPPDRAPGTHDPDPLAALRSAMQTVAELPIHDQGRVWWGMELGEALERALIHTCAALAHMAPALARPTDGGAHEEDRVTGLLAGLLQQRVLKLGWQVTSQERGGYTAKEASSGRGGIGEVDLRIHRESVSIAVGEAVLLQRYDAPSLTEHLQRLFGYGVAGVPFLVHLVWCYAPNPSEIWDRYRAEIVPAAPHGFELQRWLPRDQHLSSGVWHAVSEHAHRDSHRCLVGHFMVDLLQDSQRRVAAEARPRRRASKIT